MLAGRPSFLSMVECFPAASSSSPTPDKAAARAPAAAEYRPPVTPVTHHPRGRDHGGRFGLACLKQLRIITQGESAEPFDSQEPHLMSLDNLGRRIPRVIRICLLSVCVVLLAALLFLVAATNLDGLHSRLFANEASAVGKLRTIITLQDRYTAAHAGNGFACELPLLKPPEQRKDTDYDPLSFLLTGTQSGYRFSLANCGSDANQERVHYQVTAVPIQQDTTGFWAFCTDESGVIWYDQDGSATNCLAHRRALQ